MSKILIVEDSRFQRNKLKKLVQEAGFDHAEAENGLIAMEILESEPVDLVLTDLLMPVLDGIGLLKAIKEKNIKVPTIVVSANVQKSVRSECYSLDTKGFVNKPVEKDELLQALNSALGGEL